VLAVKAVLRLRKGTDEITSSPFTDGPPYAKKRRFILRSKSVFGGSLPAAERTRSGDSEGGQEQVEVTDIHHDDHDDDDHVSDVDLWAS
jgi:hypothetical protein